VVRFQILLFRVAYQKLRVTNCPIRKEENRIDSGSQTLLRFAWRSGTAAVDPSHTCSGPGNFGDHEPRLSVRDDDYETIAKKFS
jgi:hypothetical protein